MSKRQKAELFLAENYDFRFNVLTSTIYYKAKEEENFKPHIDYDMNSIIRKIDAELDLQVSESLYISIVKSDFTPQYHPLKDYFYNYLPKQYAGKSSEGSIEKLAKTVTVPNPFEFHISLKRWLVASVANALSDKGSQNHTCLVFTGGMGLFKTTWLSNLCPPPLNPEMIYTGKIDLSLGNKDTFTLLGIKFIINLDDQLRNLMKRDSETMKTLITHPEISIRRPFSKFHETIPRIGNFLASINGEEFLAENENRRFLPFRIKAINIAEAQSMDMNLVWLDALSLWQGGYKYWWDSDELETAFPDMNSFAYATDELEMITTHFEIVDYRSKANCTMNATEIVAYFKSSVGLVTSSKKIGEALKSLGAIQVKIRSGKQVLTKYALNRLDLPPINSIANPMKETVNF